MLTRGDSMKKIITVCLLGVLFFALALSLSWATEDEEAGTAPDPTPQEVASMEKTLQSDRLDDIEQGISGLQEAVNVLTERVQDIERTVFDDNDRS